MNEKSSINKAIKEDKVQSINEKSKLINSDLLSVIKNDQISQSGSKGDLLSIPVN